MNDKKNILQQEITILESQLEDIQKSIKDLQLSLDSTKKTLQNLKDIAWDRDSKKESSKMYKVLENDKPSTIVRSNVGDVVVDREFMEKEIHKHLDNPALRGMVTTEEMLSFSKVAKNVKAEYNAEINDHTWKVKANDESVLAYGSREYIKDDKEINRLLTAHSKTERGKRMQRQADRVSSATYFNDPNFRGSAGKTIPQNTPQTTNNKKIFSKNPKPSQETRDKLKAKMREVASKAKESKHTKDKGANNERD